MFRIIPINVPYIFPIKFCSWGFHRRVPSHWISWGGCASSKSPSTLILQSPSVLQSPPSPAITINMCIYIPYSVSTVCIHLCNWPLRAAPHHIEYMGVIRSYRKFYRILCFKKGILGICPRGLKTPSIYKHVALDTLKTKRRNTNKQTRVFPTEFLICVQK
jgi:hypothetical protein